MVRQATQFDQEGNDLIDTLAASHIGKQALFVRAHSGGVAFHDGQVGVDMRRQIRLVDDQQIRAGNGRPALAWNFLSLAH